MADRICSTPDCGKPHRARGLCSTCYNQQDPNRHACKLTVDCSWCGTTCTKAADAARGYADRFCSYECRTFMRSYKASGPLSYPVPRWQRLPVLYVAPVLKVKPEPARKRWVAGYCAGCGRAYITEDYTDTARWCSRQCSKRASKDRYRARKQGAFVAEVWRERVFRRDRWMCKLCNKRVARTQVVPHPKAAVLDHMVPLAEGGTHEPANVQCAHFMCNSIKSHRGGGEQLALIG